MRRNTDMPPVIGTDSFRWWLVRHRIMVKELEWGMDNIIRQRRRKKLVEDLVNSIKRRTLRMSI